MLTRHIDESGVAVLRFDNELGKPNLLDREAISALERELDDLFDHDGLTGVIITGGERSGFIAGADVNAIAAVKTRDDVLELTDLAQRVFDRLRTIPVPTVAAINGACLGGGLELALSCKYRVVADDAKIRLGLPEVNLGIIPGFGGSQRLPRLIGFSRAVPLVVSGRRLMAREALKRSVVDEVVPPQLLLDVARHAIAKWDSPKMREYIKKRLTPPRWLDRLKDTVIGRALVRVLALRAVRKQTGGHYPAPVRAIDVMYRGLLGGLDAGLRLEREAVADLLTEDPPLSPARHLLRVFRLREDHRRDYPGRLEKMASESRGWKLPDEIGVVGAGFMGGGIAQLVAHEGSHVRIRDVVPESLGTAMREVEKLTKPLVRKRRLKKHEGMALLDRVAPTLAIDAGFSRCGFVMEAVVERLDIKRQVMAELEGKVARNCVLATNTSSLPIGQIAEGLTHPERVIGLHFFSPVHKMPLVEIIPGPATDTDTIETTFRLATKLGKIPVLCTDKPGFLVNRVLGAYLNEAAWCVTEGVDPHGLDRAMREWGMPVGPCELVDEVGLKVTAEVAAVLRESWPDSFPSPGLVEGLIERGAFGKRSDKGGFYRYGKSLFGGRTRRKSSRELGGAAKDARARADQGGKSRGRTPSPGEARDRLLAALINEAWRAMADGVVRSVDDVDAAMIFGTGFPPFRGGPMTWARSDGMGHNRLIERLKRLQDEHGNRFAPADPPQ